jgi:DNA-binding NtrC family response regulator
MNILVIDDDVRIRDLLRLWLEREGHTVFEAENGRKGLVCHSRFPVDLVICDLIMPEQEGIETIGRFTSQYPDVGVIAISGGGRIGAHSYLQVAQHLGAWKVFAKPLDVPALIEAIKSWPIRSAEE